MELYNQLEHIDPSAKDALFRRLLREDDLGYLREDDGIHGFELRLDKSIPLSGFAIIGIQKHTILAYRSDLDEDRRLILFPTMDKLFDDSFSLLTLTVAKKFFTDNTFNGVTVEEGLLRQVVADLTPPKKHVELPQGVSEAMVKAMLETAEEDAEEDAEKEATIAEDESFVDEPFDDESPFDEPPFIDDESPFDEPSFIDDESFDDEPPFIDDEPFDDEPPFIDDEPKVDSRIELLESQSFTKIGEISDFVIRNFGFDNAVVNQVLTGALQNYSDPETRIKVSVMLFVKLMKDGRL